jgi:hypothetical protein
MTRECPVFNRLTVVGQILLSIAVLCCVVLLDIGPFHVSLTKVIPREEAPRKKK